MEIFGYFYIHCGFRLQNNFSYIRYYILSLLLINHSVILLDIFTFRILTSFTKQNLVTDTWEDKKHILVPQIFQYFCWKYKIFEGTWLKIPIVLQRAQFNATSLSKNEHLLPVTDSVIPLRRVHLYMVQLPGCCRASVPVWSRTRL